MSKLLHSEVSEILSMDRRKTLKTFAAASIASFLPPYVKARNHSDVIVIGDSFRRVFMQERRAVY